MASLFCCKQRDSKRQKLSRGEVVFGHLLTGMSCDKKHIHIFPGDHPFLHEVRLTANLSSPWYANQIELQKGKYVWHDILYRAHSYQVVALSPDSRARRFDFLQQLFVADVTNVILDYLFAFRRLKSGFEIPAATFFQVWF